MSDNHAAWLHPEAAYVHVPFCAHHCGYCDFAVAVGQDERIDAYLDALEIEFSHLKAPHPVRTLFFGGGTPSYLPHGPLQRLLRMVNRWLPFLGDHEFSVEANPRGLDIDKLELLRAFGVNRLSLGVQSFQPELLQALERDHRPSDVITAVDLIRPRFANFSVDLIFGVPGQTLAQWRDDLAHALALQPMHVATYGLTYEKGTRLWKQRERGLIQALDEETEYAFYNKAIDALESAGFEHYEISNFARPGFACRHNQVYWANHAYLGFGMGAARYVDGVRELNTRDLRTYIRRLQAGESPRFQSESLPPRERAFETMAVQLRRGRGIDRTDFFQQVGFALDDLAGGTIRNLFAQGLLRDDGQTIALTRRGKCLADSVVETLMRASEIS